MAVAAQRRGGVLPGAEETGPGAERRWIIQPGPQTNRALDMLQAYVARQLQRHQRVG